MPDRLSSGARVEALRTPFLCRLFTLYLHRYMRRHFNALRILRDGLPQIPADRPVIICANHPSWWDPVIFFMLMRLFPQRHAFGPMDEDALEHYGLLRRMGVFGIRRSSRAGAVRFLRISEHLLKNPRNVLWLTAEGQFTDPRRRPIELRTGIAHLARRAEGVVILPLALEFTFWNERTPEALACFGPPLVAGPHLPVGTWTDLLETRLGDTMTHLAAHSVQRDPNLFHTVLDGQTGVGGVYDVWRRIKAMAQGRRFDPRHDQRSAP